MPTVKLSEAEQHLLELIEALPPGEELRIMRGEQVIAKLFRVLPPASELIQPGSAKGLVQMAEDFEAPLEGFREYMP